MVRTHRGPPSIRRLLPGRGKPDCVRIARFACWSPCLVARFVDSMGRKAAASSMLKSWRMMNGKLFVLRVSLLLAVAAAVAVSGIACFELRPKMQQLNKEREEFKIS